MRATERLTKRQQEIVSCVTRGMNNRQIASSLGITYGTVKVHMNDILERTGLGSRTAVAVMAVTAKGKSNGD